MNVDIINFAAVNTGTVYFCAIGCFLFLEALAPLRGTKAPLLARWVGNIGLALVNTVLLRWAGAIAGIGAAYLSHENGWGLMNLVGLPSVVGILVTVLIIDLTLYGCHRLYHWSDMAWRFHVVHHSDEAVDVTTALRFHPFEILSNGAASSAAALLLGLSPEGLLLYQLFMSAQGFFGHSNFRTLEWLDRTIALVLVTPRFHHIHHAAEKAECHSNFAISFTFWDRIFGSHIERESAWLVNASMGVERCGAGRRLQLLWLLARPFMSSPANAAGEIATTPKPFSDTQYLAATRPLCSRKTEAGITE